MIIRIAYFSGTGCTRFVAETFRHEIEARKHMVQMVEIGKTNHISEDNYDLLIVCFVVHAFNAPKPVIDWIKNLKKKNIIPTAVFSISGGGEVTPNLACRVSIKRKLVKKSYSVFYEKMIVMPSNWIIPTKQIIIDKLFEILPYKISYYVDDIINGRKSTKSSGIGNRFLSMIGKLEHYGAILFGKQIKINELCNGCGVCVKNCPVGNIELKKNKPTFLNKCTLCLQCIYGCSKRALTPGVVKFVVLKDGFNFQKLLANKKWPVKFDIRSETTGYQWLGVQRYLLNTSEMLEPAYKKNV